MGAVFLLADGPVPTAIASWSAAATQMSAARPVSDRSTGQTGAGCGVPRRSTGRADRGRLFVVARAGGCTRSPCSRWSVVRGVDGRRWCLRGSPGIDRHCCGIGRLVEAAGPPSPRWPGAGRAPVRLSFGHGWPLAGSGDRGLVLLGRWCLTGRTGRSWPRRRPGGRGDRRWSAMSWTCGFTLAAVTETWR